MDVSNPQTRHSCDTRYTHTPDSASCNEGDSGAYNLEATRICHDPTAHKQQTSRSLHDASTIVDVEDSSALHHGENKHELGAYTQDIIHDSDSFEALAHEFRNSASITTDYGPLSPRSPASSSSAASSSLVGLGITSFGSPLSTSGFLFRSPESFRSPASFRSPSSFFSPRSVRSPSSSINSKAGGRRRPSTHILSSTAPDHSSEEDSDETSNELSGNILDELLLTFTLGDEEPGSSPRAVDPTDASFGQAGIHVGMGDGLSSIDGDLQGYGGDVEDIVEGKGHNGRSISGPRSKTKHATKTQKRRVSVLATPA